MLHKNNIYILLYIIYILQYYDKLSETAIANINFIIVILYNIMIIIIKTVVPSLKVIINIITIISYRASNFHSLTITVLLLPSSFPGTRMAGTRTGSHKLLQS